MYSSFSGIATDHGTSVIEAFEGTANVRPFHCPKKRPSGRAKKASPAGADEI